MQAKETEQEEKEYKTENLLRPESAVSPTQGTPNPKLTAALQNLYAGCTLYLMSELPKNEPIKKGDMYVEKVDGRLRYIVITPEGEKVEGRLDVSDINNVRDIKDDDEQLLQESIQTKELLTKEVLSKLKPAILKKAAEEKHILRDAEKQSEIPKLIEDERIKAQNLQDYYINLQIILKEQEGSGISANGYDKVKGEKVAIKIEGIFDSLKTAEPAKDGKKAEEVKGGDSKAQGVSIPQEEQPASKILLVGGAGVGKTTLLHIWPINGAKINYGAINLILFFG